MTHHSRFNKMAAEVYDHLAEGGRFDIAGVRAAIRSELAGESTNADLLDEVATLLAERIDSRRTSRNDGGQLDLLTGQPAAMNAVLPLGQGQRVAARIAKRDDLIRWFDIRSRNFEAVKAAHDADRQMVAELLVFMPDDDTTVEQAVAARREAKRAEDSGTA